MTVGTNVRKTKRTKRPDLGVALIGSGMMAQSHSMALRNVTAVYGDLPLVPRLEVLCDVDERLARAGAARFGYEHWSTSWQEVVESPNVDVVDIVTPNYLHRDVALAAIAAGKHVYCEKPLALTADDAREMAEAAEKAGVRTMVGFSYLWNPVVAVARDLVRSGALGEIYSFTGTFSIDAMSDPEVPFTWRQDRKLAGAGALGDLGAHVIALARDLAGEMIRVSALARTVVAERPAPAGTFGYGEKAATGQPKCAVENDDLVFFLFELAGGGVGSIECSRVATGRPYDLSFTLTGSKGAVSFDQQHMHRIEVFQESQAHGHHGFRTVEIAPGQGDYAKLWSVAGVNIGVHELKVFEAHELIMAIVEERSAQPDFWEGWEVARVLDAVEQSSETGRWVEVR